MSPRRFRQGANADEQDCGDPVPLHVNAQTSNRVPSPAPSHGASVYGDAREDPGDRTRPARRQDADRAGHVPGRRLGPCRERRRQRRRDRPWSAARATVTSSGPIRTPSSPTASLVEWITDPGVPGAVVRSRVATRDRSCARPTAAVAELVATQPEAPQRWYPRVERWPSACVHSSSDSLRRGQHSRRSSTERKANEH